MVNGHGRIFRLAFSSLFYLNVEINCVISVARMLTLSVPCVMSPISFEITPALLGRLRRAKLVCYIPVCIGNCKRKLY